MAPADRQAAAAAELACAGEADAPVQVIDYDPAWPASFQDLRFRDRLRADATLACEYAALKRRLAGRFADDREAYTEAKRQFIQTSSGGTG